MQTAQQPVVKSWLQERARDLLLWPGNLVRDLPGRARRLSGALGVGGGSLFVSPLSFGHRFHCLLSALFDLAGGPELAQFLMHLGMRTTPLTAAEQKLLASVLGPAAVRYSDIRVAEGGVLSLVFRLNGGRAFACWHTVHLPTAGKRARDDISLLVHELIHVFQYERVGTRYMGEALWEQWRRGAEAYRYGGSVGLCQGREKGYCYSSFNREAQAQMVQDYYVLLEQGVDVSAYEPFMTEMRTGAF